MDVPVAMLEINRIFAFIDGNDWKNENPPLTHPHPSQHLAFFIASTVCMFFAIARRNIPASAALLIKVNKDELRILQNQHQHQ
jgi:hypothetical protein